VRGWIKIHRSICDNWIFQRPDYFRAWINLLVRANHKEKKKLFNNSLVTINRGEVVSSLSALSKKWNMTIGRTRHFLQLLEKDQMILKKNGRDFTHLSICNYETYQDLQHAHNTLTAHSQQIDNKLTATPKERKNVKNEKNERNSIVRNNSNEFEIFWDLYSKKINKTKCKIKWDALIESEQACIIKHLPSYIKSTPDPQYRKNPLTYLNNRGWEDEIIERKSKVRIGMEEIMSVRL
jgi:hypothetical protein